MPTLRVAVINLGSADPWGSMYREQGVRELGRGKMRTLFSLTSNWNLAVHSKMNVGNKVIYGIYTPKMFVNFNKSHCLWFMHLNASFWEGVCRFHSDSQRGAWHKKKCFGYPANSSSIRSAVQCCRPLYQLLQQNCDACHNSTFAGRNKPTLTNHLAWNASNSPESVSKQTQKCYYASQRRDQWHESDSNRIKF
jgi:hypothetical protein